MTSEMPYALKGPQMLDLGRLPHSICEKLIIVTTVAIRTFAYVFLRWIPGPWIPKALQPLFAIFVPAYVALALSKPLLITTSEESGLTIRKKDGRPQSSKSKDTKSPNDTVIIEATKVKISSRRKTPLWKTVILGVPSLSDNPISTLISFIINVLCFVAVYDATYTLPNYHQASDLSFARTGWVSNQSARILIREPASSEYVKSSPVYVISWREDTINDKMEGLKPWTTVQVGPFTEKADYTVSVTLSGLKPMTKYQYLTTGNHKGSFQTAPRQGAIGKFTFLSTSCIKQRVPYNPFAHPLHIPGLKILSQLLPELKAQFMLFLGDFIYIDVPMRPGKDVDAYRMSYRQIYSSRDWESVGKHLPWIHVYDDHEIANDWDQGESGLYAAALDPYKIYQHQVNPPPIRDNSTYYTFNWGPASFFLLDTRRYRSPNGVHDGPEKTMLGATQLHELLEWLQKSEKGIQWKFIISSVPFTKNWQINGNDTWRGFQWERSKILEAAWSVKGAGVVVLSGDRHEFAATAFPPPPNSPYPISATVHEFSCSPLSQFYLPVRTYRQTDSEDVLIKYMPDGNSKFGAVEVDSTHAGQAVLKYRLFVDGKEAWNWILTSPRT